MADPAYAMQQTNFAERYEGIVVPPLFQTFAGALLEAGGVAPGTRVLDVACGTGIVARLAHPRVGPSGQVTGLDLSAQMLGVARRCDAGIEWVEGDAQKLPFEPARFDAVLCQQGLQFFPDRAAAVGEMRRVLAPGGRVAVATWKALTEVPLFLALHRVAEQHLGPMDDPRHGLGDARALEALLNQAGFVQVRVETVERAVRFPDGVAYARMNAQALVGMNPNSSTLPEAERFALVGKIVEASAPVLAAYADGPPAIASRVSTHLATGRITQHSA
jgi:ubiquinone/menaquinone biosynthesis C-methylase UbiE